MDEPRRVCEMKQIPLTQGKVALVDDADYEWLNQWKWCAMKGHNTWYAARYSSPVNRKQRTIFMHREILGLKFGDPRQTDHRNHNGLANWRDNLRICNGTQNQYNRNPQKNHSSEYKGVSWHKRRHKWRARIFFDNHNIHLGYYASEVEAAKAYDKAAIEFFGEFALINKNVPNGPMKEQK